MTNLQEKLPALWANFGDFERKIQQLAEAMGICLSDYEIDHLALRVNHEESAKNRLTQLTKCGRILADNIINGRPIYLIQLNEPVLFAGQSVEIVELPFPKNKHYPEEGWEHIEVVMPFLDNETVQQWVARITRRFLGNTFSTLMMKVSEPKAEGERLPNPSIAVSFADKTTNHTCIKVHPYSIKKILEV